MGIFIKAANCRPLGGGCLGGRTQRRARTRLARWLWTTTSPTTTPCTKTSGSASDTATAPTGLRRPVVTAHSALQQQQPSSHSSTDSCSSVQAQHHPRSPTTMCYVRGWAWQAVLLEQRLLYKRRSTASHAKHEVELLQRDSLPEAATAAAAGGDVILLLEHDPVYTLGRGADVEHLTFLHDATNPLSPITATSAAATLSQSQQQEQQQVLYREQCRQRLSRRSRGPDSARLDMTDHRRRLDERLALGHGGRTVWQSAPHDFSSLPVTALAAVVDDIVQQQQQQQYAVPVLAPNGVPIYRVERGGQVTYHGPGQLVVYPMLDLSAPHYQQDLHWFLRCIEQVIMDAVTELGVGGNGHRAVRRDAAHPGVWVGDAKLAAVGVTASRWITAHGFCLNVAPDLSFYDPHWIRPCGIDGRGVTSLAALGVNATVPQVAAVVLKHMQRLFNVDIVQGEPIW